MIWVAESVVSRNREGIEGKSRLQHSVSESNFSDYKTSSVDVNEAKGRLSEKVPTPVEQQAHTRTSASNIILTSPISTQSLSEESPKPVIFHSRSRSYGNQLEKEQINSSASEMTQENRPAKTPESTSLRPKSAGSANRPKYLSHRFRNED